MPLDELRWAPVVPQLACYGGGVIVSEIVKVYKVRNFCDAVVVFGLIGGCGWIAYDAAGRQGLEWFTQGFSALA